LAWARKDTARAADIGIAGLFIVGIAVLVIDHDRFAVCLAGMMMFRCRGSLDGRRCNQRRAENCDKRLSHFDLRNAGRPFPRSLSPFIQYFYVLARVIASAVKGRARGLRARRRGHEQTSLDPKPPLIHDANSTRLATRHAVWELKTSTFVASL
jgi:hypothetical protein